MNNQVEFCYETPDVEDALMVVLSSDVDSEQHLLRNLSESLNFPEYFGNNWSALLDCLSDLDWVEESTVVLIHNTIPRIHESILRPYLSTLEGALERWRDDGRPNQLIIVFPPDALEIFRYMRSSYWTGWSGTSS